MAKHSLIRYLRNSYINVENFLIRKNKFNSVCAFLGIRNIKTFEHISSKTVKTELHYNVLDLSNTKTRSSWSTRIAIKNKDNTIFVEKSHLLEKFFKNKFKHLQCFQTEPIAALKQYLSFINLKVDIKSHVDPFFIFKKGYSSQAFRQCLVLSGNRKIAVVNIIYLEELDAFDIEYYIENTNIHRYNSAVSSLNEYCADNFSYDYPKLIIKRDELFDYRNLLLVLLHISMKMKFSQWSFDNDLPKTLDELALIEMMEI